MPVPIDRDATKPAATTPHARTGAVGSPARPISVSVTGSVGGAGGDPLRANLALMAPGTALRDGLERILRGRTGALIVLGYDKIVEQICTGGFPLDVEFSATRVRELCKMDGAVVLSSDGTRIVRAAVHLMPDPSIPTEESGTRHRTAERVARQTGYPVISVSQSMRIISLYVNGQRHVLDDSAAILSRANQALATLERYKLRLDEVSGTLSALEIEDLVTVRDAVAVVQRLEMVRRIADEIAGYVVELGTDGRLLALQLDELMAGVDADRTLVIRDYLPVGRKSRTLDEALVELDLLSATELIDLVAVAKAIGYPSASDALDAAVSPRGFRLLAKVPRLPAAVVDRLVVHFGSLQRLLGATVEDLQAVEGVGDARARGVREGLSRLAEASILERYV
ncbi:DNA integrity scanning diadenylate cyclase DisA [Micromonospora halotolerans]